MDFRVIIVVVATDPKNASSIVDKGAETGQKVVRQAKSGNLPGIAVDPVVEVKGELKKMGEWVGGEAWPYWLFMSHEPLTCIPKNIQELEILC